MIALLLAAAACVASSDVPELKDRIARACQPGLVSIDLSGDHATLTETLVLDRDFAGRDMDPRWTSLVGAQAAQESAQIVQQVYASRRFVWQVRDRKGHALCHFTVTDESTVGRCADEVGKK
jgi:hypothetical protein